MSDNMFHQKGWEHDACKNAETDEGKDPTISKQIENHENRTSTSSTEHMANHIYIHTHTHIFFICLSPKYISDILSCPILVCGHGHETAHFVA